MFYSLGIITAGVIAGKQSLKRMKCY